MNLNVVVITIRKRKNHMFVFLWRTMECFLLEYQCLEDDDDDDDGSECVNVPLI